MNIVVERKCSPVFFNWGVAVDRPGQLVALRICFVCFGSVFLNCLADPGIPESGRQLNTCALLCLYNWDRYLGLILK